MFFYRYALPKFQLSCMNSINDNLTTEWIIKYMNDENVLIACAKKPEIEVAISTK